MINFPEINDFADTERMDLIDRFEVQDPRSELLSGPKAPLVETIQQHHPDMHETIVSLWGSQELQNAFSNWLIGDASLSKEASGALLALSVQHSEIFGLEGHIRGGLHSDIWA